MDDTSTAGSARPSGASAGEKRLQLLTRTLVSDDELADVEDRRKAEHLARLAADQELINELQWSGFSGPGWDRHLGLALAEYGLPVISAWLATGIIVQKCREKHLRGVQALPSRGLAPDEVAELANLVVGEALISFRDQVLKRHLWDSQRGASLKTYFIGHCCIRFISIYRRWKSEEHESPAARDRAIADATDRSSPRIAAAVPEAAVVRAEGYAEVASSILDPLTRNIFKLKANDYTDAEIAALLDVTVSNVKSRLYSYRRAQKASSDNS